MKFYSPTGLGQIAALPLFSDRVPCGFPSPAQDYVEDRIVLNKLAIRPPSATYFGRVSGDSMRGAGIGDGDLLVVDRALTPTHGDIVVAAVDWEFTVKDLRTHPVVQLVPHNRHYAPILFAEGEGPDIFGVVTFTLKSHRQGRGG